MTCRTLHTAIAGAALLLALSLPVRADEADYDPWNGLTAIVAPPVEVEDGGPLPDATAAPAEDAPAELTAEADDAADEPVSAWIIIELGIGDADDGSRAPPPDRRPRPAATVSAPQPLPTKLDLGEGPARLELSGSVATTDPVSDADRTVTGGGSGELRSRLDYSLDAFTLYGTTGMGAAENAGVVSVYRSLVLGGAYAAPLGGPEDGRIGAKVEIADTAAVTAGVEYRAAHHGGERFISLEQVGAPDAAPAGVVRAGVVQKF